MAKFIVEIEFSDKVAEDINRYMIQTTNGAYGFFNVIQENVEDVIKTMDKNGTARIVEVVYDKAK